MDNFLKEEDSVLTMQKYQLHEEMKTRVIEFQCSNIILLNERLKNLQAHLTQQNKLTIPKSKSILNSKTLYKNPATIKNKKSIDCSAIKQFTSVQYIEQSKLKNKSNRESSINHDSHTLINISNLNNLDIYNESSGFHIISNSPIQTPLNIQSCANNRRSLLMRPDEPNFSQFNHFGNHDDGFKYDKKFFKTSLSKSIDYQRYPEEDVLNERPTNLSNIEISTNILEEDSNQFTDRLVTQPNRHPNTNASLSKKATLTRNRGSFNKSSKENVMMGGSQLNNTRITQINKNRYLNPLVNAKEKQKLNKYNLNTRISK